MARRIKEISKDATIGSSLWIDPLVAITPFHANRIFRDSERYLKKIAISELGYPPIGCMISVKVSDPLSNIVLSRADSMVGSIVEAMDTTPLSFPNTSSYASYVSGGDKSYVSEGDWIDEEIGLVVFGRVVDYTLMRHLPNNPNIVESSSDSSPFNIVMIHLDLQPFITDTSSPRFLIGCAVMKDGMDESVTRIDSVIDVVDLFGRVL